MHLNKGITAPLRLLLLEDQPADADLLIASLRRADVRVEVKVVGTKAAYLKSLDSTFDAIISDFDLPQFDAKEALALLQSRHLDIPFIVVSGMMGEETAVDLMRLGAADYLLKDRLGRLPQALAHAIEARSLRAERVAAQMELRESEERLRAIVESALDAIVTMNHHGRIVEFNPAAERIFGYRRDQAIGRRMVDLVIPERLREDHNRGLELYLRTGEARMLGRRVEVSALRADGSEFPAELAITRIGSHEPPTFTAFVRDITERVRAGEAAARLAAIVEFSEDAIIGKDLEGIIRSWNAGAEHLFGYSEAEMVGARMTRLMPPDRLHEDGQILAQVKRGETVEQFETARTGKNGELVQVSLTASPIRDSSGRVVGSSKIARDIGEKLRTQRALHESEKRLQRVIANLTEGLVISDMQGEMLHWNPAALEMHGLTTADEFHYQLSGGANSFELSNLDGSILPAENWPLPLILQGNHVRGLEIRIRRVGTDWERIFSYGGATVHDAAGEPLAFVTINDITEKKAAEEKLRQQEKQYRVLFATYPSPTWVYDSDTLAFLAVNDAAVQQYGYSREQFLAITIKDICPPEEIPALLKSGNVISDKPQAVGVWRHRKKNGEIILAEIFSSAIQFEGRSAQLAIAIDVTEQRKAEEAIRESESRLRAIIDNEPECVKTVSADGLLLEMNAAGLRMIEAESAAQIQGHPVSELIHPEDRVRFAELHRKAAGGETGQLQFRVIGLKGRERWVDTHSVGLRNGEGTCCSVLSVMRDITDQRRAEAARREADQHLGDIINSVEGIVWESDEATGQITFVSQKAEQILGYPIARWLAEPRFWENHLHPDDREETMARSNAAVGQGPPAELDYRMISAEGREVWFKDRVNVVSLPGRSIKHRGIMLDVTHRKLADMEARAGEAQIREQAKLLDLAHDAIMVRCMDDRLVYWNFGAEKLYGWTAAEVLGKEASAFLRNGDAVTAAAAREAVIENGKWTGECKHGRKDGGSVIVRSRWTLVRDELGEPKSILIINTDITEQKKIQEQFLRAQRLESIGTLASGVAHDLNNILAPILMGAAVLHRTNMTAADAAILSTIETCAQRGADIVKQVLTFARGAEGAHLLLQPAHIINDLVKIADGTFPKSITVRTKLPQSLWPIEGDPTQLHQVFLNLSVNARDAMPGGGTLTLSAENFRVDEHYASMTPGAKPGPHVRFEVTDTGTGIPHEVIEKIFDPFFTTKELGHGTGLGLSTAMGIARSHGGFISVYSELGRGTTFKVYLPAQTNAPATVEESEKAAPPLAHGELLLIVDDEKLILQVAKTLLESHGYRVLTAEDATEALAIFALRKDEIKLVLTDLAMPLMDGIALIRTLQKMKNEVCIIASTGRGGDEHRMHQLADLHVRSCLTKPYNKSKLLTTLQEALSA
jgi:PAS domain S-box-containing protein